MITTSSLPKVISKEIKDGTKLAGDDFDDKQLERWFTEEKEAFFEVDAGNSEEDPWYLYMYFVNEILGFNLVYRHLSLIKNILVLGPGAGKEIDNFAKKNPSSVIHFLEASKNFQSILQKKFPNSLIYSPKFNGDIDIINEEIDVTCAFSVLHHIPNVSKVLKEIGRVTRSGGFLLVREPCSSMGNWNAPRSATPNERGISRQLMTKYAKDAGFEMVITPKAIIFEPINKFLIKTIGYKCIPFHLLYLIDRIISSALKINDHYWRDSIFKKFGPSSYFYVFKKI